MASTFSPAGKKLVDAFKMKFSYAGNELIRWDPLAIDLVEEAVKQAATDGFEIVFSGYAEDYPSNPKQDYPFTLYGYPGTSSYVTSPAKVYIPKNIAWSGQDKYAVLKALTHFCFELQNAMRSNQLKAIFQKKKDKPAGYSAAMYARDITTVETEGGLRVGRMLDGASFLYNFVTQSDLLYQDPAKYILNLFQDYYNFVNNDGLSQQTAKDKLVTRTLQSKFVSGINANRTRESVLMEEFNR